MTAAKSKMFIHSQTSQKLDINCQREKENNCIESIDNDDGVHLKRRRRCDATERAIIS